MEVLDDVKFALGEWLWCASWTCSILFIDVEFARKHTYSRLLEVSDSVLHGCPADN